MGRSSLVKEKSQTASVRQPLESENLLIHCASKTTRIEAWVDCAHVLASILILWLVMTKSVISSGTRAVIHLWSLETLSGPVQRNVLPRLRISVETQIWFNLSRTSIILSLGGLCGQCGTWRAMRPHRDRPHRVPPPTLGVKPHRFWQ